MYEATQRNPESQRSANWTLAKASPDLYDALTETREAAMAMVRALADEDESVVDRVTRKCAAYNGFGVRAAAALAKARGEAA